MRIFRTAALLPLVFAAGCTYGATTVWDDHALSETQHLHWDDGSGVTRNTILVGSFEVQFDLKVYVEECDGFDPPFWGAFAWVGQNDGTTRGMFVTEGTTITRDSFLDPSASPDPVDRQALVDGSVTYYLALLMVDDKSGEATLGWVSLTGNTDPHLVINHSATTTDDSIVVGAIPEPSSSLLILVGLSGLALRRRRVAGLSGS